MVRPRAVWALLLLGAAACASLPATSIGAGGSRPNTAVTEPPSDFALRFQVSACIAEQLDTFHSTLTRFEPEQPPLEVAFHPPAEEMRAFYDELLRMDFFSLPRDLVPAEQAKGLERTPFHGYRLEVRAHGKTHAVRWTDRYARAPAVVQMLPLVRLLTEAAQRTKAEQGMPGPQIVCI
jgi:hypothetical protein